MSISFWKFYWECSLENTISFVLLTQITDPCVYDLKVVWDQTNVDGRSITDIIFFLELNAFFEILYQGSGALSNVQCRNTVQLTPVVHENSVTLVLRGHPSLQRQAFKLFFFPSKQIKFFEPILCLINFIIK